MPERKGRSKKFQRLCKGRHNLYYTGNDYPGFWGEFGFRDLFQSLLARTISTNTFVFKKVFAGMQKIRYYTANRSMCCNIRLFFVF